MKAINLIFVIILTLASCHKLDDTNLISPLADHLRTRVISISLEPKTHGNAWIGSGFFVSEEGHILTTAHVLQGQKKVYVSYKNLTATLIEKDVAIDLALLKLENDSDEVPFLDVFPGKEADYGDTVYSMGTPFGEEESFFISHVSKPNVLGGDPTEPNRTYIQLDRIFFPGFSGAPLINAKRELVGVARYQIALSETKHSGLGYAIKAEAVENFLKTHLEK